MKRSSRIRKERQEKNHKMDKKAGRFFGESVKKMKNIISRCLGAEENKI